MRAILFIVLACLLLSEMHADLLIHWSFDEGSGNIANDTSGSSQLYNGTLNNMNAADWVQGVSGTALDFDGSNDFVWNENGANLAQELFGPGKDKTTSISLWFNARGSGVIVDELGQQALSTSWHDSQIEILSNGELRLRVWNSSALSLGVTTFNEWHHVVLRYNGATTTLDGFLDGVEASSDVNIARLDPLNNSGSSQEVYALGAGDTTNLGDGSFFNGRMDEFRLYDHALSSSEVALLNANPSGNAVPEPSSFVLLAFGVLGGFRLIARKRKSS